MLLRVDRDRALADLRLIIARMALMLLLRHVPPEVAVERGAHAAEIARLFHTAGNVDAKGCVIDWQHPADRFDTRELCNTWVGYHAQGRDRRFGDAIKGFAIIQLAG